MREELYDNLRIDEFGDFSMLSMTNKFYIQKCFSIGFCLLFNCISLITWLVEIVTLLYQRIFLVIYFRTVLKFSLKHLLRGRIWRTFLGTVPTLVGLMCT